MSSTQEAGTPHALAPQVPEIKHVYHHMPNATDAEAQETTRKVLAQTYTDEVVLTPFEMGRAVPEVGGAPGRGEADKPPDSANLLILQI